MQQAGYDEIRRMIREDEPPRPSSRISTLRQRPPRRSRRTAKTEPGQAQPAAPRRPGLDRDEGPGEGPHAALPDGHAFAADIERYLADEPIEARPPTLADRAAKWARRHRPVVWSAVLLVLATIGSTVSAVLLAQEQQRTAEAYQQQAVQLAATERAEQLAKQQEAAAKRQEELANEQRKLAEQQHGLAVAQREEAVRQQNAAEHSRYVSDMRLAEHDHRAGCTERIFVFWTLKSLAGDARTSAVGNGGTCSPSATASDFPSRSRLARWPGAQTGNTWRPSRDCGGKSRVNIWDITSGQRKASLNGCPGSISSIAWSPDGKYLAAETIATRLA